ncbi:TetR/AcrR family transcriptional regulator [Longispora sp. K20-0274]|uniref:TetR/AcrR family transcriptional regulator n=1 Tax=Longispora sp. K20-0274 TaxID=3088255 RepID=UPI00399B84D1
MKKGLTRELILDTALGYVDIHGLAALSMRKLGAELGVEAMTLYHYFPNKDALLDGLVDRTLELAFTGLPPAEGEHWVPWLRRFTHGFRSVLLAHPGILPLAATRPLNSPDGLRVLDGWLGRLRAAGLPLGRAMDLLNVLATLTIGLTLAEVGRTPGHEGGEPDLDGRDLAALPNLAEVLATGVGLDFDHRFAQAVDILLDGYAGL